MDQSLQILLRLRDELSPGIQSANRSLDSLTSTVKNIGKVLATAFSVQAIANGAKEVLAFTDSIDKSALKANITKQAYQELNYAASQSGVQFQTVSTAIGRVANLLGEGDKAMVGLVHDLGLNFTELKRMSPDLMFQTIGQRIGQIQDPAVRAHAAIQAFGRSGNELMPLLQSNIAGMREEAHRLGGVIEDRLIDTGVRAGDMWANANARWQAVKAEAFEPMLNLFTQLSPEVQTTIAVGGQFASMLPMLGTAIIASGVNPLTMLKGVATALSTAGGPLLILTAVATGVYLAIKHWDTIQEILGRVWNAVRSLLGERVTAVIDVVIGKVKAVYNWFKKLLFAEDDSSTTVDAVVTLDASVAALNTTWDAGTVRIGAYEAAQKAQTESAKVASKAADGLRQAQDKLFGRDIIAAMDQTIRSLGGVENVSILTAEAQRNLAAQVKKTLNVYEALGQQVPPVLAELRDVTIQYSAEAEAALVEQANAHIERVKAQNAALAESQRVANQVKVDAEGQLLQLRQSMEEAALQADIERVTRSGAGHRLVMEAKAKLDTLKANHAIEQATREYEEKVKLLDLETAAGKAAFDALTAAHGAMREAMVVKAKDTSREERLAVIAEQQTQADQAFGIAKDLGVKNKVVSIAQAVVNTYLGATKALASTVWPANLFAMASVLAAGFAQVNAIRSAPAFAMGGLIPGVGNQDSELIRAMPGEYVMRKSAVNRIGVDRLDAMNRGGDSKNSEISLLRQSFDNMADRYERTMQLLPTAMAVAVQEARAKA
jgi:hypothetical protein